MAKIFPGVSVFGFWPSVAHAPAANGLALPVRRLVVTLVSAFLIVGTAAWGLAVVNAAIGERMARHFANEPVAFQPSQFLRTELSVGYLGR